MRSQIAQLLAIFIQKSSQKLKKGRGEAAPGIIALKIDPNFIAKKHQNIKTKILITGTNGKTTTTNLISAILRDQNINHLTNLNGSNLERGIASKLISHQKENTVLWECDEAAFAKIAPQVKPTHIVINNLFRDQLDRYGEINTILAKWQKTLENIPKTKIIINSDDPNLFFLSQKVKKHEYLYFSLNSNSSQKLKQSADAVFCPICQKPLEYKSVNFSHLGSYQCKCSFKNPKANFTAQNIKNINNKQHFNILKCKKITSISTYLSGFYNLYNILASYSLADSLNLDLDKVKTTIKNFQPVKGRQEIFKIKDKTIQLLLVKNPSGFDQVIDTLEKLNKKLTILISLNDNIADGKDVSWIWDVDFEKLIKFTKKIIITGDRVYDLALRLKYTELNLDNLIICPNKKTAIKTLLRQIDKNLYILPTYTALWELRKILKSIQPLDKESRREATERF